MELHRRVVLSCGAGGRVGGSGCRPEWAGRADPAWRAGCGSQVHPGGVGRELRRRRRRSRRRSAGARGRPRAGARGCRARGGGRARGGCARCRAPATRKGLRTASSIGRVEAGDEVVVGSCGPDRGSASRAGTSRQLVAAGRGRRLRGASRPRGGRPALERLPQLEELADVLDRDVVTTRPRPRWWRRGRRPPSRASASRSGVRETPRRADCSTSAARCPARAATRGCRRAASRRRDRLPWSARHGPPRIHRLQPARGHFRSICRNRADSRQRPPPASPPWAQGSRPIPSCQRPLRTGAEEQARPPRLCGRRLSAGRAGIVLDATDRLAGGAADRSIDGST